MTLTYEAKLLRETKNYFVYQYGLGQMGNPFSIYLPKADFNGDQPPKVARLILEAA